MPTVQDVENALFRLAPRELAAPWDNVGLLVGDPDRRVSRVLVALDITPDVVREAIHGEFDLIVAHHPVMNIHWHEHELRTLRADTRLGGLLLEMVKGGVSAICMHTNLDAAQGGVNDTLAARLGLDEVEMLGDGDGVGRIGLLPSPMSLTEFLSLVRKRLRPNGMRYAVGGKTVHRVAVGGGACGDCFGQAIARGCDTFVTADVKYNQFLDASVQGLSLIDAGHFPTEDVVCPVVAGYLEEQFPDLSVGKSAIHREIIQYYI